MAVDDERFFVKARFGKRRNPLCTRKGCAASAALRRPGGCAIFQVFQTAALAEKIRRPLPWIYSEVSHGVFFQLVMCPAARNFVLSKTFFRRNTDVFQAAQREKVRCPGALAVFGYTPSHFFSSKYSSDALTCTGASSPPSMLMLTSVMALTLAPPRSASKIVRACS